MVITDIEAKTKSSLSQTALEFARECLGWENAEIPRKGDTARRQIHVYRGRNVVKRFTFTDLNEVWLHVKQWCDDQTTAAIVEWEKTNNQAAHERAQADTRVRVWLLYNNYTPGTWSAEVVQREVLRREYDHQDPCHALQGDCAMMGSLG